MKNKSLAFESLGGLEGLETLAKESLGGLEGLEKAKKVYGLRCMFCMFCTSLYDFRLKIACMVCMIPYGSYKPYILACGHLFDRFKGFRKV